MKKDRVVNIRFLFCVFSGLMLGIIFSNLFLTNKINLFVYIAAIVVSIAICLLLLWYAKYSHLHNCNYRSRRKISYLIRWSGIGYLAAFIIGLLISIIPINNIIQIKKFDVPVVINGVVCDYVDKEDTYNKFVIDDCVVATNMGTNKIKFKVIVYTSSYVDVSLGDKITFSGNLDALDYSDDYDLTQLSQGFGYTIYAKQSDMVIDDGNLILRDKVHAKVKDLLNNNLSKDNADICFAVLFGQKQGLSENISNMFSYAGISHILAVSGLHIGVLVSVLWFAIDRIKINRFVKLSILGIILLLYSYLCAFSPSVCRASLMALTLAFCKVMRIEYDSLSSLSLAGIVILLFDPLSLFTISFQLSFMCLFAIIAFAPALNNLLDKIKLPKVLASSLAMSIAVNIAILPICMNSFAKLSLLGIFTNILVLPIFSVMFVLLFSVILIALIINPFSFLLTIPNLFLHLIKVIANYVSEIPFGIIKVFNVSYILIFVIMLALLSLHFWMCKNWWKSLVVGLLFVVIVTTNIVYLMPSRYDNNLLFKEQYSSNVLVYADKEDVILIGSDITLDNLTFIMKDIKLRYIDKIVAYDFKLNKIEELMKIKKEFGVGQIILQEKFNFDEISQKLSTVEYFEKSYNQDELSIEMIEYKNDHIGIVLKMGENIVLVPSFENNATENQYLKSYYSHIKCIVTDGNTIWNDMVSTHKIINIETTSFKMSLTGELNEI